MGGTWMAVVYGFAGMRDYKGRISFDPKSPARMQQLRLPLTVRGQRLELNIEGGSVTYLLSEGTGLVIHHREEELTLAPGVPVTRPLPALRSVA
jgi:alpha,alpha-trehalose phosphorylase